MEEIELKNNFDTMVQKYFKKLDKKFDSECGLIGMDVKVKNVIHSNATGHVHYIRDNAVYAQLVYMLGEKNRYQAAEKIINRIIDVQDKDPKSITCGLWSCYFEEDLKQMSQPDYNMAEFVTRPMIYILLEKSDCISKDTVMRMKEAMNLAAHCCIRRNVGLDYTNVISMSCFTLMLTGEITGDEGLISAGKAELKAFTEYTRFNGGFSEYNSPCYFKVVGDSISHIFKYCSDEKCRKYAVELNRYLWDMVSKHYSTEFNELAPPYVRAYTDIDIENENTDYVYYATKGKYGEYHCSMNEWELNIPCCPDEFFENFEKELWIEDIYYKKNNLRKRNTDVTIIRDFESPDLTAYTYKSKQYLFGALQRTDLWDQRRTSMLIWDKNDKKTFKLRCMKDGYSFSSGMAYTAMEKDEMLTVIGFSTDHGYKHYILDLFKDGIIETECLKFTMKICGKYKKENFRHTEDELIYSDDKITFNVKIIAWMFDGKNGTVRFTDDGFELICYEGEKKKIDLTHLDETYGIISMKINGEAICPKVTKNGEHLSVASPKYAIKTYLNPKDYNTCIRDTIVSILR